MARLYIPPDQTLNYHSPFSRETVNTKVFYIEILFIHFVKLFLVKSWPNVKRFMFRFIHIKLVNIILIFYNKNLEWGDDVPIQGRKDDWIQRELTNEFILPSTKDISEARTQDISYSNLVFLPLNQKSLMESCIIEGSFSFSLILKFQQLSFSLPLFFKLLVTDRFENGRIYVIMSLIFICLHFSLSLLICFPFYFSTPF